MTTNKKVFVTVGTTKFDELIKVVTSSQIEKIFKQQQYKHITLQIGKGEYVPEDVDHADFKRTVYRLKPSIREDIQSADLVISHAGAGSCLEVLEAGRPLVVVINELLMDNHQIELADKLGKLGHLYYTTPSNLADLLETMDLSQLKPLAPGKPEKFASCVDKLMGFS